MEIEEQIDGPLHSGLHTQTPARRHRTLVSDSTLINEIIDLVRQSGGRAHVAEIADIVLKVPALDSSLAALLISDLIGGDMRLGISDQTLVELTPSCGDAESRLLHESDFVVVDVETTGAKVPPCRITEIGAYRISRNQIVDEFTTLVNPEADIPPFISSLTGITNEMVRNAPRFGEVAHAWLDFAEGAVLVAHNAHFDMNFLNHEIGRLYPGSRMPNPMLCTVSLSRRIYPELVNHRLHTVAEHFSIAIKNRHRAAGDARATAEIFLHMLARLHECGVRNLGQARQFKIKN